MNTVNKTEESASWTIVSKKDKNHFKEDGNHGHQKGEALLQKCYKLQEFVPLEPFRLVKAAIWQKQNRKEFPRQLQLGQQVLENKCFLIWLNHFQKLPRGIVRLSRLSITRILQEESLT